MEYLPFEVFRLPQSLCKQFKNTYYKLDVMKVLGKDHRKVFILLDTDCLWTKPDEKLDELIQSGELLLLDIYQSADPYSKVHHNLSMHDMGLLFKEIDPDYPTPFPVRYGGEVLAASGDKFCEMVSQLERLFEFLVREAQENRRSFAFANGQTIFEGNELPVNFVFNKHLFPVTDLHGYVKRVWASEEINNVKPTDLGVTIWHLPGEKSTGLALLFEQILDDNSLFWTVPIESFPQYLGEYVGIPERKHRLQIKPPSTFRKWVKRFTRYFV